MFCSDRHQGFEVPSLLQKHCIYLIYCILGKESCVLHSGRHEKPTALSIRDALFTLIQVVCKRDQKYGIRLPELHDS